MDTLYRNPFEDNNANQLTAEKVVDYWCNPFSTVIRGMNERFFMTSGLPIVLQGERGSGKTMILKYYSFEAQKVRCKLRQDHSLIDIISEEGQVGFYFRCEDAFLNTFKIIFSNIDQSEWTAMFDHYIELLFSEKVLDMLIELTERKDITIDETRLVEVVCKEANIELKKISVYGIKDYIREELAVINDFINQFLFTNEVFPKRKLIRSFGLSYSLIQAIILQEPIFSKVLFTITFDEFENLTPELQKRVNTLIKFVKPNISIRIGRRSEGLVTSETVNEREYLREEHDYKLLKLNDIARIKQSKKYLISVANKRLEGFADGDKVDLISVLGDSESLDWECKKVCGTKKTHIHAILKTEPELQGSEIRNIIVNNIRYDDNPIAETLNALWVVRHKKDYVNYSKEVHSIMKAFFAGEKTDQTHKYKLDYQNKYRYAITCFICGVYKTPKMYYGVNAISYISNGNIRMFMNLCSEIFGDAYYRDKEKLVKEKTVSKDIQSKAIHRYSQKEYEDICSIIQYGDSIRLLIQNIGNIFSEYHKDNRIRYPETNQFSFNPIELSQTDKKKIEVAQSWGLIIRKEKQQRKSVGVKTKGDIFTINRIFFPLFNISYRTRGGFNPIFSPQEMHNLINNANYKPTVLKGPPKEKNVQLSLFD